MIFQFDSKIFILKNHISFLSKYILDIFTRILIKLNQIYLQNLLLIKTLNLVYHREIPKYFKSFKSFNKLAYRTLIRFFSTMNPHMNQQLVSRIKRSSTRTSLPQTSKFILSTSRTRVSLSFFIFILVPVPLDSSPMSMRIR